MNWPDALVAAAGILGGCSLLGVLAIVMVIRGDR